jgi:hypothetical protein
MKYDDAEYYFLNFETELPNENGGRHIGLFLEWAIRRGLAAAALMEHADAVRSGAATGLDLLFDACDGKLMDRDLGEEGNAFAADYYERQHLHDFIEAMNLEPDATVDAIFGADLTQQRRDRVLWQLDRRYSCWRRSRGLPGKEALLERLLAAIAPASEGAGFARVPDRAWGANFRRASFARRGECGAQEFILEAVDDPDGLYGVRVELSAHIPRLHKAILAEKRVDFGAVTSEQDSARIPFTRFLQGWDGPCDDYSNAPGFWIFRDEDIEPLAQWIAARLRAFALPVLGSLDSVDALAHEYGRKPPDASAIHDPRYPYAALLSCEMARHPRLGEMLDETEQAIAVLERRSIEQEGALKLIPRMRERSQGSVD